MVDRGDCGASCGSHGRRTWSSSFVCACVKLCFVLDDSFWPTNELGRRIPECAAEIQCPHEHDLPIIRRFESRSSMRISVGGKMKRAVELNVVRSKKCVTKVSTFQL